MSARLVFLISLVIGAYACTRVVVLTGPDGGTDSAGLPDAHLGQDVGFDPDAHHDGGGLDGFPFPDASIQD